MECERRKCRSRILFRTEDSSAKCVNKISLLIPTLSSTQSIRKEQNSVSLSVSYNMHTGRVSELALSLKEVIKLFQSGTLFTA